MARQRNLEHIPRKDWEALEQVPPRGALCTLLTLFSRLVSPPTEPEPEDVTPLNFTPAVRALHTLMPNLEGLQFSPRSWKSEERHRFDSTLGRLVAEDDLIDPLKLGAAPEAKELPLSTVRRRSSAGSATLAAAAGTSSSLPPIAARASKGAPIAARPSKGAARKSAPDDPLGWSTTAGARAGVKPSTLRGDAEKAKTPRARQSGPLARGSKPGLAGLRGEVTPSAARRLVGDAASEPKEQRRASFAEGAPAPEPPPGPRRASAGPRGFTLKFADPEPKPRDTFSDDGSQSSMDSTASEQAMSVQEITATSYALGTLVQYLLAVWRFSRLHYPTESAKYDELVAIGARVDALRAERAAVETETAELTKAITAARFEASCMRVHVPLGVTFAT